MKILICGDRNWNDYNLILETLKKLEDVTVVIQGEAKGADYQGKTAAKALDIPVQSYPADWNTYGKSAGPIRNHQMLQEGKPDLILAFHDDLIHSKGTKHMVEIATKAGIEVRVIKHNLGIR